MRTPTATGFRHILVEHRLQMAAIGLHRFTGDALDLHQLMIDPIDKAVVLIQHIGETAGHAGTEVVAGLAQHTDEAAGHVLATVVTGTFHHGMSTRVAHREALARRTCGEQLAAGGAIQTGVADDRRLLTLERTARWRNDNQLAAGHALAHIVVGITFQVQMQTTRVPHPEALPGSALEAEADRRLRHDLVTMYTKIGRAHV